MGVVANSCRWLRFLPGPTTACQKWQQALGIMRLTQAMVEVCCPGVFLTAAESPTIAPWVEQWQLPVPCHGVHNAGRCGADRQRRRPQRRRAESSTKTVSCFAHEARRESMGRVRRMLEDRTHALQRTRAPRPVAIMSQRRPGLCVWRGGRTPCRAALSSLRESWSQQQQ